MNLYELREDTIGQGGFVYASGYGPIKNGMPFLHPISLERRQAFWKVNPQKPGLYIDDRGFKWPDLLANGHSPPMFFAGEKIVNGLLSIGAPVSRTTEMPIAEILSKSKKLKAVSPPRYFVVETTPGIEVDFEASGFHVDENGRPILNPYPKPAPKLVFRADTWNGSDLFAYKHFGPTDGPYTQLFCTEKVKELAEKEGWTNIAFQPLETI